MRDGQSPTFDSTLAADGFDSAILLDITLSDGVTMLHLSDVAVTYGGQTYLPDVRDPGNYAASLGGNTDNIKVTLENADGIYGFTNTDGTSPLTGATAVVKWLVSPPGQNSWQVDTVTEVVIQVEQIDQELARLNFVSDHSDPSKVVSGETVILEELTPEAAEVTTTGSLLGDGTGWTDDRNFNWRHDIRLDYDHLPLMMPT
jgi:hypothetical protein